MAVLVRNKKTWKGTGTYIGRPTPLGNPFTHIKDGKTLAKFVVPTRDEAIARYEGWLDEQLADTRSAASVMFASLVRAHKQAQAAGRDLVLVCWCYPLSCHGDILAKRIEQA